MTAESMTPERAQALIDEHMPVHECVGGTWLPGLRGVCPVVRLAAAYVEAEEGWAAALKLWKTAVADLTAERDQARAELTAAHERGKVLQARIDAALELCAEKQGTDADGLPMDYDTIWPSAIIAALTGRTP